MKNIIKQALMLFSTASVLTIVSCGDDQIDLGPEIQTVKISKRHVDKPKPRIISFEIIEESPLKSTQVLDMAPEMFGPPIGDIGAGIIPPPIVGFDYPILTPINAPMAFAQSIYDYNGEIVPWLANYIGSYGVLPSRFGDPPFLYSFRRDNHFFRDDE